MSETVYITKQGDVLDFVCWQHYGFMSGAVEAVLTHEANRHLKDSPVVIPMGTKITLPSLSLVRRIDTVKIWHDGA